TSVALSVLFDQVRLANTLLSGGQPTQGTLQALNDQFTRLGGNVLGIVKSHYDQSGDAADDTLTDKLVTLLMEQRQAARKAKDFATSDLIRNKLADAGVELKDTPTGTEWSLK
ncbi:MAG: cysteine--tRNA ligase, partial [Planctomycetes bacterium]|nr:cysteine--tRNA ligase [Planctomycetota bacterium]